MCRQDDQEARRANERARWHRRAEDRRAKGLCLSCGKHPPAPDRTRCESCALKRREADVERHRRQTADRVARGLCPRCGRTEPVPGLALCETCNGKRNQAGRARDARLRAEGAPRRDPARAKEYERERSRRLYAERVATGICAKCGQAPARPDRTTCESCAEKHRARDRERLARAKAEGLRYGGRDPEKKRKAGRKHGRRRTMARRAAGQCIRCGKAPPAEGRSMCEPCREGRRMAKKARHRQRRAAGLCVKCAVPAPGGKAYCESCAAERNKRRRRDKEAKRASDRQRYEDRRARGDCTRCGKPANGAAECQDCRDAARARYHSRRAAGQCVSCQAPTFDGAAMCAPCSVARAERRDREAEYAARRGAGAMPTGGPAIAVSFARHRRRGRPAASLALASTPKARARIAASLSGIRHGRSSSWPPDGSTGPSTARPTSRSAWPSRGSRATRWRSSRTSRQWRS